MIPYADPAAVVRRAMRAWKPPPRLSLSEWADRNFRLSAETAAEPGRWKTLPYQRGMMDAITDPAVEKVSIIKSARIGYTLMMSAGIGYFMEHEPSSILVVQPIVDDAKNFSKETIAPMLRDVPVLARMAFHDSEDAGPKGSSNTLTHKKFPGGVLSLAGANSGSGFRRISRRVVMFDEVDAYPPSAGSDGDPIKLGEKRAQAFWNRKIIAGSTPLIAGSSRIAALYEEGDQRRYFVPCPECGHMAPLVFRGEEGHSMKWPDGKPEEAFFACQANGCVIEHRSKRWMVERGEWRAGAPFKGHASFSIWAAYSYSPNSTWAHIAAEFLAAKGNSQTLQTFVNTVLGETWQARGDAPDWLRLYQRREPYDHATVQPGVVLVTAGVDVQKDRLVYEVVGWGADKQSWSIVADVIMGDTAKDTGGPWDELDKLLGRTWPGADGLERGIAQLAVDAGYNTQTVYNWARRYPKSRVLACKGVSTAKTLIGAPTAVDVKSNGKRLARGYKVWPVGVDVAKAELYGWLRLDPPTTATGEPSGEPHPPGYCHFPAGGGYGEAYFKQLTAEQLMQIRRRSGFITHEWQVIPGRENHWLDCRIYARAAAARAGLDQLAAATRARTQLPPAGAPAAAPPAPASVPRPEAPKPAAARDSWLGRGRGATVGAGSWLSRRR